MKKPVKKAQSGVRMGGGYKVPVGKADTSERAKKSAYEGFFKGEKPTRDIDPGFKKTPKGNRNPDPGFYKSPKKNGGKLKK